MASIGDGRVHNARGEPVRILAIYRHYWPDVTPYARMLRAILEDAVDNGHEATVVTAQPSYNDVQQDRQEWSEVLGGVAIRRLPLLPERKTLLVLRLINMCLFLTMAAAHVIWNRRRYDIIIANSHPPILMGAVLWLLRATTGTPYIIHVHDIHPESSVLARRLREGRLVGFLRWIDTVACRRAHRLVTLCKDMGNTLMNRDATLSRERIEFINNFSIEDPSEAAPDTERLEAGRQSDDEPWQLLFAGNIGLFQHLHRVIDVAHYLRESTHIHFRFMGAGAARESLIELAGPLLGKTVFFDPFQPVAIAYRCMQESALGIVSLSPGVYRVAYPSKTMMYVSAGCPVLALVEPESELADEIRTHQLGVVPRNLSTVAIATAILEAYENRSQWSETTRRELRTRGEDLFGRKQALHRWQDLFETIADELGVGTAQQVTRDVGIDAQQRAA